MKLHDFSRIARSTKDLLDIVDILNTKGIHLVSNKKNKDTSTPTGKLMITMIGAINEFERTNLLERQKEGIAIAVKEGKYKGRKKLIYLVLLNTIRGNGNICVMYSKVNTKIGGTTRIRTTRVGYCIKKLIAYSKQSAILYVHIELSGKFIYRKVIDNKQKNSDNQTTVLAIDECVIGCATICYIDMMPTFSHPTGKRAHLMNVYTNCEYRRRGIAI